MTTETKTTKHREPDVDAAIAKARRFAERYSEPYSVWQQDGRYFVCRESAGPIAYVDDSGGPFRPVATYDQHGREYA